MQGQKRKRLERTSRQEPASRVRSSQWYLDVLQAEIGSATQATMITDVLRLIVSYIDRRRLVLVVSEESSNDRRVLVHSKGHRQTVPSTHYLVSVDPDDPDERSRLQIHLPVMATPDAWSRTALGLALTHDLLWFDGGRVFDGGQTRLQLIPTQILSKCLETKRQRRSTSLSIDNVVGVHAVGKDVYIVSEFDQIAVWQLGETAAYEPRRRIDYPVNLVPPNEWNNRLRSVLWNKRYLVLVYDIVELGGNNCDTRFITYDTELQQWRESIGFVPLFRERAALPIDWPETASCLALQNALADSTVRAFQCTLVEPSAILVCWFTIASAPAIVMQINMNKFIHTLLHFETTGPSETTLLFEVAVNSIESIRHMKWNEAVPVDNAIMSGRRVALAAMDDRLYAIQQQFDVASDQNMYSDDSQRTLSPPTMMYLNLTTQEWHMMPSSILLGRRQAATRHNVNSDRTWLGALGTQALVMTLPLDESL